MIQSPIEIMKSNENNHTNYINKICNFTKSTRLRLLPFALLHDENILKLSAAIM